MKKVEPVFLMSCPEIFKMLDDIKRNLEASRETALCNCLSEDELERLTVSLSFDEIEVAIHNLTVLSLVLKIGAGQ